MILFLGIIVIGPYIDHINFIKFIKMDCKGQSFAESVNDSEYNGIH